MNTRASEIARMYVTSKSNMELKDALSLYMENDSMANGQVELILTSGKKFVISSQISSMPAS